MWQSNDLPKQISTRNLWDKPRSLLTTRTFRINWSTVAELSMLLFWAVVVGWPYLDFDQTVMPAGGEFGMAIQPSYIWTLFTRCGACVFWNGFVNGGNPAFVELHGVVLHPLVIITTMLWGGLNGAKVALVALFALAGFAQWWLARVLRLGTAARLWSSALAISGGHIAGRMNLGVFGMICSTVACSLLLAPMLDLALHGRRRSAVLLGVMLALALVSGQGYLQIGVFLALVPAVLLFIFLSRERRRFWKEFLLAGILALLLAGVFLVPLVHFWPNFGKDTDPGFVSVQPVEYLPLNLVIHDPGFYTKPEILSKLPYPYLYVSYISWVPVLLALIAMRLTPRRDLSTLGFMCVAIVLLYFTSSFGTAATRARLGSTFLASVRHPSLIAGLAVPLILAIAAWGLDRLLARPSPYIAVYTSPERTAEPTVRFTLIGSLVALPLLWALFSTYSFDRNWILTTRESPEVAPVLDNLRTDTTQWIEPPYGEHYWTPPALYRGLKLTTITRPWHWKDRAIPQPHLRATRNGADDTNLDSAIMLDGITVGSYGSHQYAAIYDDSQQIPCEALALGGNIDVTCTANVPGQLIVQENSWTGWYAYVDGVPVALEPGPVLGVWALAGTHHYTFRYRPWDVSIGLGLTVLGIIACAWLWWRAGSSSGSESFDVPVRQ